MASWNLWVRVYADRAFRDAPDADGGADEKLDHRKVVGWESAMPNYTPEAKCEEARVLSVMISHARIGVFRTYTKIGTRRFRKRPSEFIEYLNEAPGFLCGRESIEAWCGKAGWPARALL